MFLAQKLGRTLRELRDAMDQPEFVLWTRYYLLEQQDRELAEGGKG